MSGYLSPWQLKTARAVEVAECRQRLVMVLLLREGQVELTRRAICSGVIARLHLGCVVQVET